MTEHSVIMAWGFDTHNQNVAFSVLLLAWFWLFIMLVPFYFLFLFSPSPSISLHMNLQWLIWFDIPNFACLLSINNSLTQVSTSKASSAGQNLFVKPRVPQKKSANGNGIKQSPLGRTPTKGPLKQRLHPGMLSSQDRATAHYGAVTGLKITEDGMYLLSAGDWTHQHMLIVFYFVIEFHFLKVRSHM